MDYHGISQWWLQYMPIYWPKFRLLVSGSDPLPRRTNENSNYRARLQTVIVSKLVISSAFTQFVGTRERGICDRWMDDETWLYDFGLKVHIFTYHANLLTMYYDPAAYADALRKYAMNKLMRFALRLSAYHYLVEHISGEANLRADMISRWATVDYHHVPAQKATATMIIYNHIPPVRPTNWICTE